MRNEINLFDLLLAKKLSGGGGTLEPVVYTATGWNELPHIDSSKFFPASETTKTNALGFLSLSFGGAMIAIPVYVSDRAISGGATEITGTGATMLLTYDNVDEEWSVTKAWTNLPGSWTDITSAVQVGASDIELTLFK